MNRRRLVVLLAVTAPLALVSVALLVWIAPFWIGQARDVLEQRRWPEQRGRIEAALAGTTLPGSYRETDCAELGLDPADRCWWTDAPPPDTTADLQVALAAAGATGLETDSTRVDGAADTLVLVHGSVAGRVLLASATREVDEQATLAAGELVLRPGSLVRLIADLDAP